MKIAVPTRDGHVDDHFGHCAYYTVFEIEDKQIVSTSRLDSPEGCGCKSNIASEMEAMGIKVMLAGNMGEGARRKLESHNIKVIRGCKGDIEAVVKGYCYSWLPFGIHYGLWRRLRPPQLRQPLRNYLYFPNYLFTLYNGATLYLLAQS